MYALQPQELLGELKSRIGRQGLPVSKAFRLHYPFLVRSLLWNLIAVSAPTSRAPRYAEHIFLHLRALCGQLGSSQLSEG